VVVLGYGVLTYVENVGGKVNPASLELLSKARELASARGGKVYSVFVTALENSQELKELAACGADVLLVYKVSESQLSDYLLHAEALTRAIRRVEPAVVLVSATPWGRSVAPRVAARLGLGLTADCLDVYVDEAGDIVQVPASLYGQPNSSHKNCYVTGDGDNQARGLPKASTRLQQEPRGSSGGRAAGSLLRA
jgi:electron transfer flavoprotein alpha subunit